MAPYKGGMDIVFDRNSWTNDPAGRAGGFSRPLEWHGLRARLCAARAARRVLNAASAAREIAAEGSFDGVSARLLADYGPCLPAVNPVFWANRKPARTMAPDVAGETSPGDRG
jgi:hypothetical protein